MVRNKRKFVEAERERVAGLTNRQLYEEFRDLSPGDDPDGCFTDRGEITFTHLREELERRLAPWLAEDV